MEIPLTPATVDHSKINIEIDKAKEFYNEILNNDLIGILGGQHPQEVVDELLDLIADTEDLINKGQLNQWDTNTRLTLIQKTIEKVQATVNSKGDAPEVTGLDSVIIKAGEEFDPMVGVTITDDFDTIDQLKVTVYKGDFDNTKADTYIIKYSDKNVTVVERTVIVEEKRVDVIEDTTNNKPNKANTHNSDKDTSKNEINKAINFIM